MKLIKLVSLLSIISCLLIACATGKNSQSYSTLFGDITIVDNGGTATTNKTTSNTADVAVAANDKVVNKLKK
jgi:hypothetical protein